MKAAFLIEPGKVEFREISRPEPAPGEVLIQPIRVGICGSDVSFFSGHRATSYPHLLGHELVGRVVAAANGVTKFAIGARVIVEPNYTCGSCHFCLSGRGCICPNKKSMGVTAPGCFADYVAAPAEYVWQLPDNISDLDAATIEPLAVSVHALVKSGARAGDTVAVVGCGGIGLLLIHAAVAEGVRVLAHGRSSNKLDRARQLGAVAVPNDADVTELWREQGVSSVFETAGSTATVELAIGAAPRGSTVLLLGLSSSPASFVPLRLVRESVRIEPSLIYDHPSDFARTIELVANGALHPSCIVTSTFPFEEIGRALEVANGGPVSKVQAVVS